MSDRIGVVGGGIVGLAVARRAADLHPGAEVVVFEKEADVGRHQTGRNSGVVHAGVYYQPGSLKAELCRRGVGMLREFCASHGITYDACGKVIVAVDDTEIPRLRDIENRARQNGVPGLRVLDEAGLRHLEPHVRGRLALHSPTTAIVNFTQIAEALAAEIRTHGGSVRCDYEVVGLRNTRTGVEVRSRAESVIVDRLIICGGLQTDRLARHVGAPAYPRIVPFRGEYYELAPTSRHLIRGLVYPVPDPRFPFLGVHFTKSVDGRVLVGPNAVLALAREGYGRASFSIRDVAEMTMSRGFRALVRQQWRMGLRELASSVSKRRFARLAQRYVPGLARANLVPAPSGVRAQAVDTRGQLVDDFEVNVFGNIAAVRNAPSPAATSSMAIAELICERVFGGRARM